MQNSIVKCQHACDFENQTFIESSPRESNQVISEPDFIILSGITVPGLATCGALSVDLRNLESEEFQMHVTSCDYLWAPKLGTPGSQKSCEETGHTHTHQPAHN